LPFVDPDCRHATRETWRFIRVKGSIAVGADADIVV